MIQPPRTARPRALPYTSPDAKQRTRRPTLVGPRPDRPEPQTLTYDLAGRLIGVPRAGLGQLLEPIQSYCLLHDLPPLTALVVSAATGLPGTGFTAAADVPRPQQRVFAYDWVAHGCPSPDAFAGAVQARPSNGGDTPSPA